MDNNPTIKPYAEPGPSILAIDKLTLMASFALLVVGGSVFLLSPKRQSKILEALSILCFVDSFSRGAFLGNSSMNASFIAVSFAYLAFKPEQIEYPFKPLNTLKKKDFIQIIIDGLTVLVPVLAVFASGQSIPVGALALVVGAWVLCEKGKSALPLALCFMATILIIGFVFTDNFLANSGRFEIWKINLKEWWENLDIWIGAGNGEFYNIGPETQKRAGAEHNLWWIWAHNDWLQTLIEQGIIGLGLHIGLFSSALWKTFTSKRSADFAAVVGYGGVCFFNFNVHMAIPALLGLVIVARVFDKERI